MALVDNKPRVVTAPRELQFEITLSEACVAGDQLKYDSGWKLGAANTATMLVVALESGASGDKIAASPIAVLRSFSGATAGAALSSAASGAYQSGTGYTLGIFVNDTTAIFNPSNLPVAP